jgi:biopolymer transport protein ExbD
MHKSSRQKETLPLSIRMDVTPLIDIVFLLLVFFMLTSTFAYQVGVKVHLPKAVTADVTTRENIVISISGQGILYLGSQIVTPGELRSQLRKKAASQPPILIRADQTVSLGRVVQVWDLCRALGISQVNIATSDQQR